MYVCMYIHIEHTLEINNLSTLTDIRAPFPSTESVYAYRVSMMTVGFSRTFVIIYLSVSKSIEEVCMFALQTNTPAEQQQHKLKTHQI